VAYLLFTALTVVGLLAFSQSSDAQLAALHRMMTTVNAGDAAGYAGLYAPEAIITIYGTGELKGRAAIEAHEVDLLRQYPGARLAFSDVWQDGPRAVVRYAINAPTPKGPSMGHEGLLFFRFDASGAITEEHRYQDSPTPMAQLGALRAPAFRAVPDLPAALTRHAATRSPGEKTNASIVTDMFAAMNAGRQSASQSFFADDAAIDELFLPQPFARKDAPAAWLKTWADAAPGMILNVTTMLPIGDFVLVEGVARGSLTRALGLVPAADRPFAVRRGFIIRLHNSRISSLVGFMNGKELAEAVGSWPIK
jgi:uncharacterized protein (TIGR02246 family)